VVARVSKARSVDDEVDVFREPLDDVERFRKRCPALEEERTRVRQAVQVLEQPDDPKVLFDNRWDGPEPSGGCVEVWPPLGEA